MACGASRTAGRIEGHQVSIKDAAVPPEAGRRARDVRGLRSAGRARGLLVGGQGSPRSFRLAARYADEFNLSSSGPEEARKAFAEADAACEAIGRDPSTLTHSTMAGVLIGRNEAEMDQRLSAITSCVGAGDDQRAWLEERLGRWITGTPEQARDAVGRFAAAGVERIMLQDLLPWDLEMIDVMGEALVGQV